MTPDRNPRSLDLSPHSVRDEDRQEARISANTMMMIAVAVFAAVALAGSVAFWGRRMRSERRLYAGTSLLDEAVEDARLVQQHDRIVDELAAKAEAAEPKPGMRGDVAR
ncbi:MAG: hypothetical protein ABW137_28185 [Mycobacterium sp.]